ncbi:PREDICTED: 40S ribosomal protein S3 isoform X1 [Fulmarus glacialis]|uniref:40S ribosomal protein S3 isoform X1 n=1 Tax=Fulmarus glacialis TaxID=30455 RepID=UPI00051AF117|nr:PREDICTED: 40S ribosomal protein S3 isoform X1 [Fulmarus glacialis]
MESGAKGCEVVVSGKLRGQRAKSMKFVDGLMIHSGDPVNYYVDTAVRHVLLRQGDTGDQSKDYVALGPKWKDWPQKAAARPCQHCGTQRRDLAHHPHFRAERWQTRTASHASAGSHCLRGFVTSATRSLTVLKTSL